MLKLRDLILTFGFALLVILLGIFMQMKFLMEYGKRIYSPNLTLQWSICLELSTNSSVRLLIILVILALNSKIYAIFEKKDLRKMHQFEKLSLCWLFAFSVFK